MPCSPNNHRVRARLFLGLTTGLLCFAAGTTGIYAAEPADAAPASEAPQSIVPAAANPAPKTPVAAEKAPAAAESALPTIHIASEPGNGSGITVGALAQVDPSSVGLIDPSTGGFPADMWAHSDRALIEKLVPLLPVGNHSPVLQGLRRRLLISAAVAPAGPAGKPTLLALRLDRLAKAGDLADTLGLLGRLPPEMTNGEISRLKVNASLLAGELTPACNETENIVQNDPEPYWAEIIGYCHALKGDRAAAGLTIEMLQDRGVEAPLYYQLMARLTADEGDKKSPVKLGKFSKADPLLISMIQTAGLDLPTAVVANASPLMVQALATSAALPADLRLDAAERAARNGSLSPKKLAEIYGAISFAPEERAKALDLANSKKETIKVNALLYQAALAAPDIAVRGPILKAIWARAKKSDTLALQARVNAIAVADIDPSPEAEPYVHEISRFLLLAGQYQRLNNWVEFIRLRAATGAPADAAAMADLWPLATVVDRQKTLPWSPGLVDRWWQSQQELDVNERSSRGALLFSVFEALGYRVPDAAWTALIGSSPTAEGRQTALPYARALEMAAKHKRLGETVLLSLISLGDGGPDTASPASLGHVISSLRAVGLDLPARQIAVEALVARGF